MSFQLIQLYYKGLKQYKIDDGGQRRVCYCDESR